MAISTILSWQESLYYVKDSLANTYNLVLDNTLHRIEAFYTLITHSERAGVAFLAGILIVYFTVAFTVLFDEAYSAYKRMPK